jgi:hypothetical protein
MTLGIALDIALINNMPDAALDATERQRCLSTPRRLTSPDAHTLPEVRRSDFCGR